MTVKGFEKGNFIAPTIVSNVTVSKRDCPHSFCVCSEGAFHFAKDSEISVGIALIAVISGLTCERGERVNFALY